MTEKQIPIVYADHPQFKALQKAGKLGSGFEANEEQKALTDALIAADKTARKAK